MEIVVIILLLIFILITSQQSPLIEELNNLDLRCEINNSKYWDLVDWYFERTPHIMATTITENSLEKRDYATLFLKQLTNCGIKLTVSLSRVDYFNEDDSVSYANTFDWKGQKFELRSTENLIRNKRLAESAQKPTLNKKKRRLDEPKAGVLIFAHNIQIINNYLVGTPRRPFQQPRKYFILFVAHVEDDWKKTGAIVLERLWKRYGIIHAMLIAPCSGTGESVIGQFDPFYLNESIKNPLSSSFGRCTWTDIEDFDFDTRLLRKLASLNQFPLKVSLFFRYPTVLLPGDVPPLLTRNYFSKVSEKTNNFSGLDSMVLGNMAEAINFKPDIRKPDGKGYGHLLPNGTFTGSLGDVIYTRVYASFNSRFISDYGTKDIEYLFPVFFDKLCVITPKTLKIPQWMAIFKCFNITVWFMILFMNSLCGFFWYLLKICVTRIGNSTRRNSINFSSLTVISIEMWIIMLGGTSHRLPYRSMERVFLSVCLISNIIIAGSFQGSLFNAYSRTTYFKEINTLDEVDKSGLPIGTTSANLKDVFSGVGTAVLESLNSKYKVLTGQASVMVQTAKQRDICCVERLADMKVIIASRYENNDGTVLLHTVRECPRSYYLSYIVRKGWPFKPVFDKVIQRYFEGGLLDQWHAVVEESIIYFERIKRLKNGPNLKKFSLDDMQTAFYILGIGLMLCSLVFVGEILHQKHSRYQVGCNCSKLKLKSV